VISEVAGAKTPCTGFPLSYYLFKALSGSQKDKKARHPALRAGFSKSGRSAGFVTVLTTTLKKSG